MTSTITEIVGELAVQNPGITAEQITEIMISSLESESVVSAIVSDVEIPSKLRIELAELKSERLPKRRRAKTLERIENANFFKRLKLIYSIPTQDSDLMKSIHSDGARVDLTLPSECSDSSHVGFAPKVHLDVDKTYERIQTAQDSPREYLHAEVTEGISPQNTKENKESISGMLAEVEEEFETSRDFLSLYYIHQMTRIMKVSPDLVGAFDKILDILEIDIKKRNREYRVNCIDELYKGDNYLPEELRVSKPSNPDMSGRIHESLAAVILHEYRRLHDQCGQEFIAGQITYDTYIETTNRYSMYADRLFSELPV